MPIGGCGGGHKLRQEQTIGTFQILYICHLYQYRIHRNHPVTLLPLPQSGYRLVCLRGIFNVVIFYGLRIRFDCKLAAIAGLHVTLRRPC